MDLAGVLSGEDYGELLAAKPGRNTGGLGHPTHYAGDIAQHLIAGLMPPGVVESLEVIDIEHGQGQGPMLGFGLATGGIQLFVERLAIGQICQRVGHRVAAELFEVITQTGDLPGRGLEAVLQRFALASDLAGRRRQT